MNTNFILGFGAAWLLTNKQGQKVFGDITKVIDKVAKEAVKFSYDTVKETLPETSKIIGGVVNAIPKSEPEPEAGQLL